MRVLRMNWPTRVTRLSFLVAQRALPSPSASTVMLRNFSTWNFLPFKPTRSWRKNTGAPKPSSHQIARTVSNMKGQENMSNRKLAAISDQRLASMEAGLRLKPSVKLMEPGVAKSTSILPASRSKNVTRSYTSTPLSRHWNSSSMGNVSRLSSSAMIIWSISVWRVYSASDWRRLMTRSPLIWASSPPTRTKPTIVKPCRSERRRMELVMVLAARPAP